MWRFAGGRWGPLERSALYEHEQSGRAGMEKAEIESPVSDQGEKAGKVIITKGES